MDQVGIHTLSCMIPNNVVLRERKNEACVFLGYKVSLGSDEMFCNQKEATVAQDYKTAHFIVAGIRS